MPRTQMLSLIATGTPHRGLDASPRSMARCAARLVHEGEGVDLRVRLPDAPKVRAQQLRRGDLAPAQGLALLQRAPAQDFLHFPFPLSHSTVRGTW